MNSTKHRRSIEILITLAGVAGFILFLALYDRAFPSAALKMTRSRSEITKLAQQHLAELGYSVEGYEFALSFQRDSLSSIFLQRTVGIPETNRLIQEENLPLWYWNARWFKPMQQEEFSVYLLADGRIAGYGHTIPESEPGESLDQAAARVTAEQYLAVQGWDLSQWMLVSASSEDRPARRDHSFTWKRTDFDLQDAEIRLLVGVNGDQVGWFDYGFKTPEQFTRDYSEQRTLPNFINNLSLTLALIAVPLMAMIPTILALFRKVIFGRNYWKPALVVAVVLMASQLNYLPASVMAYSTTQPYLLFWVQRIFASLFAPLMFGVLIYLLIVVGQTLARQIWPREDKILARGPNRWEALARSSWRGFLLGGVLLGYAVLFYVAATQIFGGWVPVDVDYYNLFASPLPFLGALENGVEPAFLEESVSRLIGISLFLLLLRKKWLALLIPGAFWAFAHLSYVRDPFYMRGIELLITAVFIEGLAFLYFDLTTTIVAHMTYNSFLGALLLLRSSEPYLVFNGVLVVAFLLLPVIVGIIGSRLSRKKLATASPQIRQAQPEDLPGLQSLPIQGIDWAALLDNPGAAVLKLELGEQLLGAAAGEVSGETARMLALYVAPGWRGQFWGSRLADEFWPKMQSLGAQQLETTLPAKNTDGQAFLGSLGWEADRLTLTRLEGMPLRNWWNLLVQEFKQGLKNLRRGSNDI